MTTTTAETCAACGREFGRASKPEWAFTRAGEPLGRIHRGCRRVIYLTAPADDQDVARFWVWEWDIQKPRPNPQSDRWHAGFLLSRADTVSESLTYEQERLLQHWIDGGLRLDPERAATIRAAYADLVREYQAWRAADQRQARGGGGQDGD